MKMTGFNEKGEFEQQKHKYCELLNGKACIHREDKRQCNIICDIAKTHESKESCGVAFCDYSYNL